MESYNLNLTDYRQRLWLHTAYRNLTLVAATVILALTLASLLWVAHQKAQFRIIETQQNIEQLNSQLQFVAQRIEQYHAQKKQKTQPLYLTKNQLTDFLNYLSQFSLHGILENSQLYMDNTAKIKISGKLPQQSMLEQITEQLKQQHRIYKLDYLQQNEQQQFEFSLTIPLQETLNEKLDP